MFSSGFFITRRRKHMYEFKTQKSERKLITTNFGKIGSSVSAFDALCEGITNSISAALKSHPGKVAIDVLKGDKYPFLEDKNADYISISNNGEPVKDLFKMYEMGYSEQNGDNHIFGMGHKIFLSKFSKDSGDFYTFTKKQDHFELIKGPYIENPEVNLEIPLEEWPFEEWVVTCTICKIVGAKLFDDENYCKLLGEKFAIILYQNKDLEIAFNGKKVECVLPKECPDNIRFFNFAGYKFTCYHFYFEKGEGSTDNGGVILYSYGRQIPVAKNSIILNKSSWEKIKGPEDIPDPLGKDCKLHNYLNLTRAEASGVCIMVDILPDKIKNELVYPFKSDKSGINFEEEGGRELIYAINKFIGDEIRELFITRSEGKERDVLLEFLKGDSKNMPFLVCKEVYLFEKKSELSKYMYEKGTVTEQDRMDIVKIPVTSHNQEKVKKYIQKSSEKKQYSRYDLSEKDLFGLNEKNPLQIYEFKALSKKFDAIDVQELLIYADELIDGYTKGMKHIRKQSVFINKKMLCLKCVGSELTPKAERALNRAKRRGYKIEFIPYPVLDQLV